MEQVAEIERLKAMMSLTEHAEVERHRQAQRLTGMQEGLEAITKQLDEANRKLVHSCPYFIGICPHYASCLKHTVTRVCRLARVHAF